MKLNRREALFRLPLSSSLLATAFRKRETSQAARGSSLEVALTVSDPEGRTRREEPVSRGVPLPPSAVWEPAALRLLDEQDRSLPVQFRPLAAWPDGSLRWVLTDWLASLDAGGEARYRLVSGSEAESAATPPPKDRIRIEEDSRSVAVSTGPLRFRVNRRRFSLIEEAALGETEEDGSFHPTHWMLQPSPERDATVTLQESFADSQERRFDYGMGGKARASLAENAYRLTLEEVGPLRAVVRCDGAYQIESPMGIYWDYRPFLFTTRIYAWAGQTWVRFLHTFTVACNVDQVKVQDISIRLSHSLQPDRFVLGTDAGGRLVSNRPGARLSQPQARSCRIESSDRERWEGTECDGWGGVAESEGGKALLLMTPHFSREFPKALTLEEGEIRLHVWRGSQDESLDFRRYSPVVLREEYEGIFSDGLGVAKTTEFLLDFRKDASGVEGVARMCESASRLRQPLDGSLDPEWCDHCGALGGFQPAGHGGTDAEEELFSGLLAWMERHIRNEPWFGMFDYGDVQTYFDVDRGRWRRRGGWGWINSEWDFRHGVWIQYLRTGNPKWQRWGEIFTRHSVDVDTCHYQPLRPYFVGGSYRHCVDHWGDEPSAAHTFIESWLDFYWLTGDGRTLDVIHEAGEFFLRFRWTHHPRISFSLRTVANVFRGLLHLYELTWERRYLDRAKAILSEVILPAQNPDGSWNRRFVLARPDRIPEYLPFGLATEGQTTFIEMGTMPPYTRRELSRFDRPADRPELTAEELKGYQSHYLLLGLEQYYRLTGRADVAQAFLKQVDWFCGRERGEWVMEGDRLAESHLQQARRSAYYGILARECAVAFELSGDSRYLEAGRAVVDYLIERQDRSQDLARQGSVMIVHNLVVGPLLWGVPYFLKQEDRHRRAG